MTGLDHLENSIGQVSVEKLKGMGRKISAN